MATTPPTITAAPTAPQRGDKTTFSNRVDLFVTWLVAAVAQFAAVATNVYNNAVEAFNNAQAAGSSASAAAVSAQVAEDAKNAAAVTTGATLWVSGQSVALDAAKISPADRRTYRRKTATGSGTTDPSIDATNYVLLSADVSSYALLGTATVASPVANIDFLTLFSDAYVKYVIEVVGAVPSANDNLSIRLAVSGTPDAGVSAYTSISTGALTFNASSVSTGTVNTATAGATYTLELRGMRSAAGLKNIEASGTAYTTTAYQQNGIAGWANAAVSSGLRLFWSAGANFTAGTVRVYGVRA